MTRARSLVAFVLAAALVAAGIVGAAMAWQIRSSDAAGNLAVVDANATSEVQAEVSQALGAVLSYDHADPGPTEAAADSLLSGDAREEYDTLFASLQERAPDQELVLTAQVQAVAVKELDDDSAQLLVFLDQSSQRAADDEASVSAAQLSVQAEKQDGDWVITGLDPL
ncbi:hypothetical protein [Aeromicrobium sp. CTD01-1L150]|uniref:hypothetical protein n=1 Tax=Aeromicrobium sp. CTD01-1L150 TaxID=3341830 RepID=UPI0035BED02A